MSRLELMYNSTSIQYTDDIEYNCVDMLRDILFSFQNKFECIMCVLKPAVGNVFIKYQIRIEFFIRYNNIAQFNCFNKVNIVAIHKLSSI
jgi:hypothetical protein